MKRSVPAVSVLSVFVAAGAAFAQPANDACSGAVDLSGETFPFLTVPVDISTAAVAAETVPTCGLMSFTIWYKLVANDNGTIDMATCLADAPGNTLGDTVLSVFESADGTCDTLTQVGCNDDACDGLKSRLSVACTSGVTYYLQVGKFATAAPAPGTFEQFVVNAPADRTVPGGSGAASPNSVSNCAASPVLFTVATIPVQDPPSTGITVTGHLENVGGSATQQFFDNGTNGDVTAGDGTFSYAHSVPAGTTSGNPTITFTVRDAQDRSSNGSIALTVLECPPPDVWVELGDAGDLPATAQVTTGSGPLSEIRGTMVAGSADMYLIGICDQEQFSATLVGGATFDTQMFLFNTDGVGVTFNDDSTGLQSTITGQFVPGNGDYYLAIAGYNNDPLDSDGQLIWINTPFNVERAPDGPGAAGVIGSWSGGGAAGAYTVRLFGACYPGGGGGCPPCAADFNQDGGVDGSDVEAFFTTWESGEGCGDVNQDGGVDGADVEAFYVVWEAGGC